jgi:uncharacterized protein (TIGR02217 family)
LLRANLPVEWHSPAFDVLQLEDYEWVTAGLTAVRRKAMSAALSRLGYDVANSHFLAGFVSTAERAQEWSDILRACNDAANVGFNEVLLWALPQVLRDGLTIFEGDPEVQAFRDVTFPLDLGLNAAVEPCFSTTISTSRGGFEYRNVDWQQARLRFDVGAGLRSVEDLQLLLRFFRSMRGNALAFRFRDSTDCSSAGMTGDPTATDICLGAGDGSRRRFPLIKIYGNEEVRRITRPVPDTISVSVDGLPVSDWELTEGGILEFFEAPSAGAAVHAGFLFDVPVRFEEPTLRINRRTYLAGEITSVPLIEVREA